MPKIPCPAGRTRIRAGKTEAVWHKKDGSDCPVCSKTAQLAPATESSPLVSAGPAAAQPEGMGKAEEIPSVSQSPPDRPRGLMRRLGFGTRETSPELPVQPPKNKAPEYFVDAKHTIEFANLIYGGARFVFNLADKLLLTKEAGMKPFTEEHPDLVKVSDFEKESITMDPQTDLWGKFATGVTRMVGCQTQAQAHSAIDTLSFLGHFGMLIGFALDHYVRAWREGKPYRQAKSAAKKAAIAARKMGVTDGRNPQGEGGDMASAGRQGLPAPA